jgi:ABC-type Mn2+/Zn2+ transport system ATPase subunit
VADVVTLGLFRRLGLFQRPSRQQRAIAIEALSEVGLDDLAERSVATLDSGQRARVLLARALVQQPEVLLLDALLDTLDGTAEAQLFALIRRIRDRGRTVVVATRELQRVAERFDDVVLLNGGVIAAGPAPAVLSRANLRAAYGSWPLGLRVQADYFATDA